MNDQQYEATLKIKQAIQEKIDKNERIQVLDSWSQSCGTYGCVGGDTAILLGLYNPNTPKFFGAAASRELLNDICETMNELFEEIFGFSDIAPSRYLNEFKIDGILEVTGASFAGTLQERLDYVNYMIKELRGEKDATSNA